MNNVRGFINNVPEEFDRFRVGGRFTESFRDIGVDKLPGNSFVVWAKTTKAEMKIIDEKEKEKLREENKQAEKRVGQEAQRAEQTKEVSAVLSEAVFDSDMDKDLKKATIKSLVDITSAIVQHVIEYNSSPEQVINSIIEEIKCNKDQVLKDKTVSTQLIEIGISKGVSAGIGK